MIVKALAQPEAIICKIAYPLPFTEQEKTEARLEYTDTQCLEYRDEFEYFVDPERITAFEIIERGEQAVSSG